MKIVVVTGGVISGLGKGITAASIARLLTSRGKKVFMQKLDPYLNIDPGTMNPAEHGEVFVTADGMEVDLDLGHYERFIDTELSKYSSITSGRVYQSVLEKERRGHYKGKTVQVVPHVTNEIKDYIKKAYKTSKCDVMVVELGGTIGDIESLPFIEALRQLHYELGNDNIFFVHTSLLPYVEASGEFKSKPTQHSVKELRGFGITPNMIVLRSHTEYPAEINDKISLMCDVDKKSVITAKDQNIYSVPVAFAEQNVDKIIFKQLKLKGKRLDLSEWHSFADNYKNFNKEVKIGIVGKYAIIDDSYLSVIESLEHSASKLKRKPIVEIIDSEKLEDKKEVKKLLSSYDGLVIAGGYGSRGTEGKINAIEYARVNKIPTLGICLGMQLMTVEYARNVLNMEGANSIEFDKKTKYPVISLQEGKDTVNIGGTNRLGDYPTILKAGSLAKKLYGEDNIIERHRHRYEFNNDYREALSDGNFVISGISPDDSLVEVVEQKNHPFMIAAQYHPEFISRPFKTHPLFDGLVKASIK